MEVVEVGWSDEGGALIDLGGKERGWLREGGGRGMISRLY